MKNKDRRERRMKNRTAVSQDTACIVCGSFSSAWYCSACTVFFDRAVAKKKMYTCKSVGRCTIFGEEKPCRHCRLEKCYRMGMGCYDTVSSTEMMYSDSDNERNVEMTSDGDGTFSELSDGSVDDADARRMLRILAGGDFLSDPGSIFAECFLNDREWIGNGDIPHSLPQQVLGTRERRVEEAGENIQVVNEAPRKDKETHGTQIRSLTHSPPTGDHRTPSRIVFNNFPEYFASGSSPIMCTERYLKINSHGFIAKTKCGYGYFITAKFYDKSITTIVKKLDTVGRYDCGDLNEHAVAISTCTPASSIVVYPKCQKSAAWTMKMPENDQVLDILVSSDAVVAITLNGYIRTFSFYGTQRVVLSFSGKPITACATQSHVAIAWVRHPDECQGTVSVYPVSSVAWYEKSMATENYEMALTHGASLEWLSYTPRGRLVTMDSMYVFRILIGGVWMPAFEGISEFASANVRCWPVFVDDEKQCIWHLECVDQAYPQVSANVEPKMLPWSVPLCNPESTRADAERMLLLTEMSMTMDRQHNAPYTKEDTKRHTLAISRLVYLVAQSGRDEHVNEILTMLADKKQLTAMNRVCEKALKKKKQKEVENTPAPPDERSTTNGQEVVTVTTPAASRLPKVATLPSSRRVRRKRKTVNDPRTGKQVKTAWQPTHRTVHEGTVAGDRTALRPGLPTRTFSRTGSLADRMNQAECPPNSDGMHVDMAGDVAPPKRPSRKTPSGGPRSPPITSRTFANPFKVSGAPESRDATDHRSLFDRLNKDLDPKRPKSTRTTCEQPVKRRQLKLTDFVPSRSSIELPPTEQGECAADAAFNSQRSMGESDIMDMLWTQSRVQLYAD